MDMTTLLLAAASGGLVGFSLGLVGGGGSILATPLLLYVVGVGDPHLAIGTSALAVSANAALNALGHARAGNVRWKPALLFAAFGVVGAALGSTAGKHFPGQPLLFLFALLMIAIAARMLFTARREPHPGRATHYPSTAVIGFFVGAVSGFFGIGGGFLIVPGLMWGAALPILSAIGSSLVAVTLFGLTTAMNYAVSGLVAWDIAAAFIGGGFIGGWAGRRLAGRLSLKKGALNRVFAAIILLVAVYMLLRIGVQFL